MSFPIIEVPPEPNVEDKCDELLSQKLEQETKNSPEKCSICLSFPDNSSYTDNCFHKFCFVCLLEWSKIKSICPLCKQPFRHIIHNVRSCHDYNKFKLLPPETSTRRTSRPRLLRHHPAFATNPEQIVNRANAFVDTFSMIRHGIPMNALGSTLRDTLNHRRFIYARKLLVRPQPNQPSRQSSPQFYLDNRASTHRLVVFLQRDLTVLIGGSGLGYRRVRYVVDKIMRLILVYPIRSEEFAAAIQPFTRQHTDQFVHEFYYFAISPHDTMAFYDVNAIYDGTVHQVNPLPPVPLLPLSTAHSRLDDQSEDYSPELGFLHHDTVVVVSSSESDDSDDDMDIETVAVFPPVRRRQVARASAPAAVNRLDDTHNPEPPPPLSSSPMMDALRARVIRFLAATRSPRANIDRRMGLEWNGGDVPPEVLTIDSENDHIGHFMEGDDVTVTTPPFVDLTNVEPVSTKTSTTKRYRREARSVSEQPGASSSTSYSNAATTDKQEEHDNSICVEVIEQPVNTVDDDGDMNMEDVLEVMVDDQPTTSAAPISTQSSHNYHWSVDHSETPSTPFRGRRASVEPMFAAVLDSPSSISSADSDELSVVAELRPRYMRTPEVVDLGELEAVSNRTPLQLYDWGSPIRLDDSIEVVPSVISVGDVLDRSVEEVSASVDLGHRGVGSRVINFRPCSRSINDEALIDSTLSTVQCVQPKLKSVVTKVNNLSKYKRESVKCKHLTYMGRYRKKHSIW